MFFKKTVRKTLCFFPVEGNQVKQTQQFLAVSAQILQPGACDWIEIDMFAQKYHKITHVTKEW